MRFGPDGSLYFSEATGGGGGRIYRLEGGSPAQVAQVDFFWRGDFDVGEDGTIWISTGEGRELYKLEGGEWVRVFRSDYDFRGFKILSAQPGYCPETIHATWGPYLIWEFAGPGGLVLKIPIPPSLYKEAGELHTTDVRTTIGYIVWLSIPGRPTG